MFHPAAWLDDDQKHVWFGHDCISAQLGGRLIKTVRATNMLPYPRWHQSQTNAKMVEPSIECKKCGFHAMVQLNQISKHLERERSDDAFRDRLADSVERNRPILDALATESPPAHPKGSEKS